jgi:hypothetical protein
MKNTSKVLTFITVIAIIGLMILPLTGCGESTSSDLQRITVTVPPAKTSYIINEDLNTAGMVVTAIFSDGSKNEVSGYSTSGFDSDTAGVKNITVTYKGMTAPFFVTVYSKVVTKPTANLDSGVSYFTTQNVTLSTTTEGASIYYTLDGKNPTKSSTLYSSAINISATTLIKAIAVKDGWADSGIMTEVYYVQNTMTANTWSNGIIATAGGIQWFKFTAKAHIQYIHFQTGTLTDVYMQMYEADRKTPVGAQYNLYTGNLSTSRTLTIDKEYYIKIWPYSSTGSGTYKLAFSELSTAPTIAQITVPTTGVTTLAADVWTDGNIPTLGGEQWFKFTATTTRQYFCFQPGEFTPVSAQLYIANGTTTGTMMSFTSINNASQYITIDTDYYIRVFGFGTYKIAFTAAETLPAITWPTTGVTTLTAGKFADGYISSAKSSQWFKFTATADSQYIIFQSAKNTDMSVNVQFYSAENTRPSTPTSTGISVDDFSSFGPRVVTEGNVYYILITQASPYTGAFKITISSTSQPIVTLPASTTTLYANAWANNGSITAAGGEQWFKFTVTVPVPTTGPVVSVKQYIHFQPNTLDDVYVQLYTSDGYFLGNQTNLYQNNYTFQEIYTSGDYYIRVWPYNSAESGTFKLGLSTSPTAPK